MYVTVRLCVVVCVAVVSVCALVFDGLVFSSAMSHLNGVRLHGRSLRVSMSKHTTVQLPREGMYTHYHV